MNTRVDIDLIRLLERHRKEAAKIFDLYRRGLGGHEVNMRLDAIASQIEKAMKNHQEFATEKSLFFFGRQILCSPLSQARNMLSKASQVKGEAALHWYRKVLNTTSADINIISEVYGLNIHEPIQFPNEVKILPAQELIDTPHTRILASKWRVVPTLGMPDLPAAAVLSLKDAVCEENATLSHSKFLDKIETIRRTVTALTLSGSNTPVTGISWTDFEDPDLNASAALTSFGSTYDGRLPSIPTKVDPAGIEFVGKVLSLTGTVASVCDVALARLNLAKRRRAPGDQAIDGCIALEALLSDGQPGDLTYKLRLRAARLLGNDFEERKQISRKIGQFYRLRGKVVHGQSRGASEEDRRSADDGLDLALALLRQVVVSARLPDIQMLELGPADDG